MPTPSDSEVANCLENLDLAVKNHEIAQSSVDHIHRWLTTPGYEPYRRIILDHVEQSRLKALDDAFWTILPFGTGGRRGPMYPIGTNAINERTLGESAQGLANYLRQCHGADAELSCVIAHDSRNRSVEFSQLSANVLASNGIKVALFSAARSTPQLSFAVRQLNANAGIVISASHNPPSDNGFKCYWDNGGQVLPPHDQGIMECVSAVTTVASGDFDSLVSSGMIRWLGEEDDQKYIAAVSDLSVSGERGIKMVYSPLHGVGTTNILPVLHQLGFHDVELVESQATMDGDFPNVANQSPNPEQPAALALAIEQGKAHGADLILASDPDADRLGGAAPNADGDWIPLNGNQIAGLITEHVVQSLKANGQLTEQSTVVKTSVTTELISRIAEQNGLRCVGDLPVGFKWIGQTIDEIGAENFVLGCEESHGYLAGGYARDKDGTIGAIYLAELAAKLKKQGSTIWEELDRIHRTYGYHTERLVSRIMEGREGAELIANLMTRLRQSPPQQLGGMPVTHLLDYQTLQRIRLGPDGKPTNPEPFESIRANQIVLVMDGGRWKVVGRPSGTEPKIKLYFLGAIAADRIKNLGEVKSEADTIMNALIADLDQYVQTSG